MFIRLYCILRISDDRIRTSDSAVRSGVATHDSPRRLRSHLQTCSRSPTTAPRSGSRRRRAPASRASRAVVDRQGRRRRRGLRRQHRLRQFRRDADRQGRSRGAAAESAAQPRRRRRRAAAGARRARVDGAARQRAGQGLFRHSRRDARGAARAAQSRRASARAEPRIGRRQRRSRAARAPRARADRRRRDVGRAANRSRRRGAGRSRPDAGRRSAPKEGLALINGTQVSTAVLALALAGAERLAAPPTSSRRCRSTRCSARCIRSSRASTRRVRSRDRRSAADNLLRLLDGSAHQRVARQLRSRAGRLLDALRAAGARRGARSAHLDPPHRRDRDERRDRQPDGVRRRRATSSPAATFTARRWRWPPICW